MSNNKKNRYSDSREFDKDNFKRYLSNRRFLGLRFSSAFMFGSALISTLMLILFKANLALTVIAGIAAAVGICVTLHATFTFMSVYKTYQDDTSSHSAPFSSTTITIMKWSILLGTIATVTVSSIAVIIDFEWAIMVPLILAILTIPLAIFTFINLTKMDRDEDRFKKLSKEYEQY